MSEKHTPEPWEYCWDTSCILKDSTGEEIARSVIKTKNGKRIVACVNAMKGIEDPEAFMEVVKKLELDAYQKTKADLDKTIEERDLYKFALQLISDLFPANHVSAAEAFYSAREIADKALKNLS